MSKSSAKLKTSVKAAENTAKTAVRAGKSPAKTTPSRRGKKPAIIETPVRAKSGFVPHVTRPTPEEEIIIGERRELVLDLRKKSASIRQIAKILKTRGFEHCSVATVHADLEAELAERDKRRLKKTDSLVTLELEKIDNWEFSISPYLEQAGVYPEIKIAVVNSLIRVQNQRDKFENLTKAQKADNDWKSALAQFLEIDPEEIPDDCVSAEA